jgi:hypothetical protein
MNAAVGGHLKVLRLLLKRGAVVDAVALKKGNTAFHFACHSNQTGCMEALVNAICDISIMNKDGYTGRQLAEGKGHTALVSQLEAMLVAHQEGARLYALQSEQLRVAEASTPPRSPVGPGPFELALTELAVRAGVRAGAEAVPETENPAAHGMAAQDVAHSPLDSQGGSAFAAGPAATEEAAPAQVMKNRSQASQPAASKDSAEVHTSPADVPVVSDAKARPNAPAVAEQGADGAAARQEFVQQPSSGTWYSVDLWSWKAEIAVVVLVCFILVSRQRAAGGGMAEGGPGTQRGREVEASLAAARRQAEREAEAVCRVS